MICEVVSESPELLIRRLVLEPGESSPWHVDVCHRFTVVISGDLLSIEFGDGTPSAEITVSAGLAEWNTPDARVHRAVNIGTLRYEEIVSFYRDDAAIDPQPVHEPTRQRGVDSLGATREARE